jgi:hypothetical protein
MAMTVMNMVSAGSFSGVSFHLRRCPQGVASVLCKKTPIFGSRWSKLDHLMLYQPTCQPILELLRTLELPPDHLLLDSAPNIGPLISRWELDIFKNCWNKSFRTFEILTLLYQRFSNLLISQRDMSGPRLGALSNNRWSGRILKVYQIVWSSDELLRHVILIRPRW